MIGILAYNKSIKFARKIRGLDAAHKTRIATYFRRYQANKFYERLAASPPCHSDESPEEGCKR